MEYSFWDDLFLHEKITFWYFVGALRATFLLNATKFTILPVCRLWCLQTNKLKFRSDKGILPFSESAL